MAAIFIGTTARTESDANGIFRVENLPPGEYLIRVEHVGFEPWRHTQRIFESQTEQDLRPPPAAPHHARTHRRHERPSGSVRPAGEAHDDRNDGTEIRRDRRHRSAARDPGDARSGRRGRRRLFRPLCDTRRRSRGEPRSLRRIPPSAADPSRRIHIGRLRRLDRDGGRISRRPAPAIRRCAFERDDARRDAAQAQARLLPLRPRLRGPRRRESGEGSGRDRRGAVQLLQSAPPASPQHPAPQLPGFHDEGDAPAGGLRDVADGRRVARPRDGEPRPLGRCLHVRRPLREPPRAADGQAGHLRDEAEPHDPVEGQERIARWKRRGRTSNAPASRGKRSGASDPTGRRAAMRGSRTTTSRGCDETKPGTVNATKVTGTHEGSGGFFAAEGTWSARLAAVSAGGRVEKIAFTKSVPVSPYVSVRFRRFGRVIPGVGYRIVRESPFPLYDNPQVAGLSVDANELLLAARNRVVPQQATHISGSCEITLGWGFQAVVEGYEKKYDRLITWESPAGPKPGQVHDNGDGRGRGLELTLRREAGRFATGWFTYSLSKTRKLEGPSTTMRPSDFDRPRMAQFALDVPVRGGTTMSFAYRAASGRPYTEMRDDGSRNSRSWGDQRQALPVLRSSRRQARAQDHRGQEGRLLLHRRAERAEPEERRGHHLHDLRWPCVSGDQPGGSHHPDRRVRSLLLDDPTRPGRTGRPLPRSNATPTGRFETRRAGSSATGPSATAFPPAVPLSRPP